MYRWSDPGAGQIAVEVFVAGAATRTTSDARGGTPTSLSFWFQRDLNGYIVATAKSTTVPTSDSWGTTLKQNAVVPPQTAIITATGSGEWAATPVSGNVNVTYSATTDIGPFRAGGVAPISLIPYSAYTYVSDPMTVTVNSGDPKGSIPLIDTLNSGSISLGGAAGGMEGFAASDMQVNGQYMYRLFIDYNPTVAGNTSFPGVTVQYLNQDGSENTSMESLIDKDLSLDTSTMTLNLISPITVFNGTITNPAPGTYAIDSELITGIDASVPEPGSLALVCAAGATAAVGYAARRGKNWARSPRAVARPG